MRLEKTAWDHQESLDMGFTPVVAADFVRHQVPGFGFDIGWIDHRRPFKPFVRIQIWRWWFQVGWCYDYLDVEEE